MKPLVMDWERLKRHAGKPPHRLTPTGASKSALGLRGLARWWLRREVLERAATDPAASTWADHWTKPPRLESAPGACWVLFALENPGAFPALRPALVVPFRWEKGNPSSPLLPPSLRAEAGRVIEALRGRRELALDGVTWGLQPGPWKSPVPLDLSRLDGITCRSAWAALAGGLILATLRRGEARPNPDVWASGSWEPSRGIQRVDHLPAKLRLAREFGARCVFVPQSQRDEGRAIVEQDACEPVEIGTLIEGEPSAWDALAEYRHRLDAPPSIHDPFERRVNYYLRQAERHPDADSNIADHYYQNHLLPELVQTYRQQIESRWPGQPFVHLITIVSNGAPELIPIAVGAFQPRHLWLIHTTDRPMRDRQEQVREWVHQQAEDCAVHPLAFENEEEVRSDLPARLNKVDWQDGPRVLDLTLGTKLMSLVLDAQARPCDRIVYWAHRQERRRVVPGSQRLLHRDEKRTWSPVDPEL